MSATASRPNGPHNGGQKLPEKFRCKIGGEWKPLSSFSNKQQKTVQGKLQRQVRIDAANSGMVCRIHSGEPIKEIQCEGPCNQVRVLDDFSKNSRTNGVNICKACQHWVNTQEPGYAPWAGPHTNLDPLEKMDDFETRLPTEPSDIFDLHDGRPLAPITGTYGFTGSESNEAGVPSLRSAGLGSSRTQQGIVAPRLGTETIAFTRRTTASIIPESTSQASPEDFKATSLWFSEAQIAQTQTGGQVKYNAWDSTGQQYQMFKTPTVQSGRSLMVSDTAGASNSRGQNPANSRPQKVLDSRPQNTTSIGKPATGGTWAGDRHADRKQLSEKEHRELQRNMPQRQIAVPYGDTEHDSDDDE